MKLSNYISISNVLLVILTIGASLLLTHSNVRNAILASELEKLELVAAQVGDHFEELLLEARSQVIALRSNPAIDGIIRARRNDGADGYDGKAEARLREQLHIAFSGLLKANTGYSQIRYIGVADGGREIVRVDRMNTDGSIRVVSESQLQPKGDRDYFKEALKVKADEVYVSEFGLNRENGIIQEPYFPTVRFAIPVFESTDTAFGIVVINLDLSNVLNRVVQVPIVDSTAYIVSQNGDYLHSPNVSKNWGFEFGRNGLAFSEFPLLAGYIDQVLNESKSYATDETAIAYAQIKAPNNDLVYAVVSVPLTAITGSLDEITRSSIISGGMIGFVAILIGVFTSHFLSSPLSRITKAIQNYNFRDPIEIEKSRICEVRTVADVIENLSEEIQSKSAALEIETTRRVKANELAEAKGQFLANMSHEIRTPINGIVGSCDCLRDLNGGDESQDHLRTIDECVELLLRIIDDILDFSKIQAGKLPIEETSIDPSDIVRQVVKMFGKRTNSESTELVTAIDSRLPKQVIGDPVRLKQVLMNLVSNAIKFTEMGVVKVSVTMIQSQVEFEHLRFEVEDTGIGISPEQQTEIFQMFNQAETSTTRRFGGTGLGLAIAGKLVELMGGSLAVSSEEGVGSKFYFSLRLRTVRSESEKTHDSKTSKRSDLSGARVLLADDNEVGLRISKEYLKQFGCEVTTATTGQEVIDLVGAEDFNVILMDCHMPEMDGFEATLAIRRMDERMRNIPIIALTASATVDDQERCRRVGMDAHLAKPFRKKALKDLLLRFEQQFWVRSQG